MKAFIFSDCSVPPLVRIIIAADKRKAEKILREADDLKIQEVRKYYKVIGAKPLKEGMLVMLYGGVIEYIENGGAR